MPIAFYIGSYWGTAGIAAAWTFVFPFTTIPLYVRLFRLIQLRPSEYLSAIAPSLAGAIAMAACLLAVGRVLPSEWPALVRLLVEVAAGAGIYSAILFVAFRDRLRRYLDFLKSLKKRG
jgi:hypothetical protein